MQLYTRSRAADGILQIADAADPPIEHASRTSRMCDSLPVANK